MPPALSSPGFLVALAVLLANDLWWKAAFGNWLTGKLSDFAILAKPGSPDVQAIGVATQALRHGAGLGAQYLIVRQGAISASNTPT